MFKQPLEPNTIMAFKALVGTNGKEQVHLPVMGLGTEDIDMAMLGREVAAT